MHASSYVWVSKADIWIHLISNPNYRSCPGKGPNGADGTWYVKTVRGGYPYERKYFVANNAAPGGDPRHNRSNRPWENYPHHSE